MPGSAVLAGAASEALSNAVAFGIGFSRSAYEWACIASPIVAGGAVAACADVANRPAAAIRPAKVLSIATSRGISVGLKGNPNLVWHRGKCVVVPWQENGGGNGLFHLPQIRHDGHSGLRLNWPPARPLRRLLRRLAAKSGRWPRLHG